MMGKARISEGFALGAVLAFSSTPQGLAAWRGGRAELRGQRVQNHHSFRDLYGKSLASEVPMVFAWW